jgi:hypothetical protein
LLNLGRLEDAVRQLDEAVAVTDRDSLSQTESSRCRIHLDLAEVSLRSGHLAEALRMSVRAGILAVRKGKEANEARQSHAYVGSARGLCGDVAAALRHFRRACTYQHRFEYAKRPLYGLYGLQLALLLAQLGEVERARRLTEANVKLLEEMFGRQTATIQRCHCLLADLARRSGDLAGARALLGKAQDWALARDARELLCWAALVRGRIAVAEALGPGDAGPTPPQPPAETSSAVEEGLRIARGDGYAVAHIDLLVLRGTTCLLRGDWESAEQDARTALFGQAPPAGGAGPYEGLPLDETSPPRRRGIYPPLESGLPDLLAATNPACGYAWGEADALQLLAEALLLHAAQLLGRPTILPARRDDLPPDVRTLLGEGQKHLERCLDLRRHIRSGKRADTEQLLRLLEQGVLTAYPLRPQRPGDGPGLAGIQENERFCWIVLVGVSTYQDPARMSDLPGVATDIENLRHTLDRCVVNRIGDIWDLRDQQATKEGIAGAIKKMAEKVLRSDKVILYLAGHGYELPGPAGASGDGKVRYFLPYEATGETAAAAGLSAAELTALLADIPAGQLLVLFDCCHSGGLLDIWGDLQDLEVRCLDRMVIASTRARQQAGETDAGSFFLPAFCDALAGRNGKVSGDRLVTVRAAYAHAKAVVDQRSYQTGHPQVCTQHSVGNDIVLTRVASPGV